MIRLLLFLSAAVVAAPPPPSAAQVMRQEDTGRLSLFILAGQSNMSGRGALPADEAVTQRVYLFGNDYRWKPATEPLDDPAGQVDSVSLDDGAAYGPGVEFARMMVEGDTAAVVGLIPCAMGATLIEQWQRDLSDRSLYGSCLKRVLAASPMGVVKGLLFFQGESDGHRGEEYRGVRRFPNDWAEKFTSFVQDFRRDLRQSDLPVVFAQIGPHASPDRYVHWETVQGQQASVDLPGVQMITTSDLSLQDRVHYDTPSYRIIGRRFAEAMKTILQSREIDLQGHRGARGLLPENSLPGFRRALELGVTTLEMDAVISADRKVVVSHEPWMSASICRTPDGRDVKEEEERFFNLFQMTYEEIARFDCGSRGHALFPRQQPVRVEKPLLEEVIRMAESYAAELGRPAPLYNIEIKSKPENDRLFHPVPAEFARLLYDVLEETGIRERATVQSFDPRALQETRKIDEGVTLALLVDNLRGLGRNLRGLGFLPEIFSPNFKLVSRGMIDAAHELDIQVLPWTVNDARDMRRLLEMGVDGIITDYPDLGREVVDAFRSTDN